jgi:glc operon protein GlcG
MNSPNRLVYALFALSLVITKSASAEVAERKVLTLEGVKRVIAAAEAYASGPCSGGVIAVVDDGGNLIAL